jgi:hypothetical protein
MKIKRMAFAMVLVLAVSGFTSPAYGLMREFSLSEITAQSELIVKGKVVATESKWVSDQWGRHIYTYATIAAGGTVKGTLAGNLFTRCQPLAVV